MKFTAFCVLLALVATEATGNGEECQLCEIVVGEVESAIQNQATDKEIEAVVKNLCNHLPSSLSGDCTLLTSYLPEVLSMLKQELKDAGAVCRELSLCSSSLRRRISSPDRLLTAGMAANTARIQRQPSSSVTCIICEYIMSEVDHILAENATKQEIEAVLQKVCSIMPSSVRSECDAFMKTYVPVIVNILSKEMKPSLVCGLLKVCTSFQRTLAVPSRLHQSSSGLCAVCTLVFTELDTILSRNASEAEIVDALEKVCSVLPAAYQSRCDALVKQYAEVAISLIKKLPPATICKELSVCT